MIGLSTDELHPPDCALPGALGGRIAFRKTEFYLDATHDLTVALGAGPA